MDPVLRLRYLDALGITQYVARKPLPGAKPSVLIDVAPATMAAGLEVAPVAYAPAPGLIEVIETAIIETTIPKKPFVTDVSNPESTASQENPLPVKRTVISQAFQCQVAYWHTSDLLILADMPRLDKACLLILNDILFSIQREKPSAPEAFHWPIEKVAEKSLHSAQEYFQGLLDTGLLKREGLRQILLFGRSPLQLLGIDENGLHSDRYQDWPVIALPGLRHMLEHPASKADAWKKLLPLVKHEQK